MRGTPLLTATGCFHNNPSLSKEGEDEHLVTPDSDLAVSYCFHLPLPKASGCFIGYTMEELQRSISPHCLVMSTWP